MDYQRNDRFRPVCPTCRSRASDPYCQDKGKARSYPPYSCETHKTAPGINTVSDPTSLAMVFSPKQPWQALYDAPEALSRGTLFKELDKPFAPALRERSCYD
ncbi:MAG: spore coat associated protein CotJA [Clostridia bacterium]|nr:spore coat associated protein CotJA [Clostridia bacterium]